jgi:hypothetical protein
MSVSGSEIVSYFRLLEDNGWTYEQHRTGDGTPWWKAHSNPPHPGCLLHAVLSQGCLVLEVPLAVRPLPECRPALWRYLLRLNGALKLAKFTLDPGENPRPALRAYTAHYRREIEVLAAQPALAQAWMSLAPRADGPQVNIVSRVREA